MKSIFLSLLVVTLTNQAMATGYECIAKDENLIKIIADTPTNGNPDNLTIIINGQTIYRKVPVVSNFQNQRYVFQSPKFRNKNEAPASLFLQLYEQDNMVRGEFSEISYLPVVPHLILNCRGRNWPPEL